MTAPAPRAPRPEPDHDEAPHVAVWMDHAQARIFHLMPERAEPTTVSAPLPATHHRHREGSDKDHPGDAQRFMKDLVRALDGAGDVLLMGPSGAKHELMGYVREHDHALQRRIIGVETVDHPTPRQLVAYAKAYFRMPRALRPPID